MYFQNLAQRQEQYVHMVNDVPIKEIWAKVMGAHSENWQVMK